MNTEILAFISSSISTSVTMLLFFLFYKNIYGARYHSKLLYLASYLISVVLLIGVNQLRIVYINVIYSFISVNVICLILFNSDIKKMWLHNFLFWFSLSACDIITIFLWSIIEEDSLKEILSNYQLMFGSNLLFIILMIIVYKIYTILIKRVVLRIVKMQTVLYMAIMIFFEVWILHTYAIQITNRLDGIKILIMLTGFLLVNLYQTYIINRISEAYKNENDLTLAKRLCEIHLDNFKILTRKYDEARTIIHDVKKHIEVANDIKNINNDSYSHYLSEINDRINNLFGRFRCSNKILSVILSQKISYAREKGIFVDIEADEIPIEFIDDFDITAIFANLWDNAIEACCQNEGKNFIKMKMTRFNSFIAIDISNSFNGAVNNINEKYLSTKPAHDGIGLKSIRLSVEKYDGIFIPKHNDFVFTAEITIPIPQ